MFPPLTTLQLPPPLQFITILIVIDMAGFDGREPHEDYQHLLEELRLYRHELAHRPHMVVANKMDLPEARKKLQVFVEKTGIQPLEISAEKKEGMDEILKALYQQVFDVPAPD